VRAGASRALVVALAGLAGARRVASGVARTPAGDQGLCTKQRRNEQEPRQGRHDDSLYLVRGWAARDARVPRRVSHRCSPSTENMGPAELVRS